MKRFFFFLIWTGISYLFLRYRKQIGDFTGPIGFAEHYIGGGGTYTFIALLGIAIFFLALMYVTGSLDIFLGDNLGQFFGNPSPNAAPSIQ